jgi:thiosulfate dehydrogenase [quinone] large subunit
MSTPDTTPMDAELFGRSVSFEYSEHWVGYSLLILRVTMGWVLFQGGIVKILDPSWSAQGFLLNAIPEGNPLTGFFAMLANNYIAVIDPLNAWGLTLTGLLLIFYWLASLQGGLMAGLPLAHGWVVDDHIIYAALLFGLGAFGSGRILGLDEWIEDTSIVQNNSWLKYFLG